MFCVRNIFLSEHMILFQLNGPKFYNVETAKRLKKINTSHKQFKCILFVLPFKTLKVNSNSGFFRINKSSSIK